MCSLMESYLNSLSLQPNVHLLAIIILSCYLFYLIAYFAETSKLSKLDVFLPTGNTIFVVGKGN